jgi:prepilin signal peptidase PulO-like enzyme (type II secretory pathway)
MLAIRVGAVVVGAVLGLGAGRLADVLPARYGITHLVQGKKRTRRNTLVLGLVLACSVGVGEVIARVPDLETWHAILLLAFHSTVTATIICASAIDFEHMILPHELTIGGAVLCLATSPLRAIGVRDSAIGAVTGFVVAYVPFWIYKRIRGHSGMGLGDAMFAVLAGAWFGPLGAVLVLFGGAFLMPLATIVMRTARIEYAIPESVIAELAELRAKADAGDAEAKAALDDDPMAANVADGILRARLPLGPFLAVSSLILLFARRYVEGAVWAWLSG